MAGVLARVDYFQAFPQVDINEGEEVFMYFQIFFILMAHQKYQTIFFNFRITSTA